MRFDKLIELYSLIMKGFAGMSPECLPHPPSALSLVIGKLQNNNK